MVLAHVAQQGGLHGADGILKTSMQKQRITSAMMKAMMIASMFSFTQTPNDSGFFRGAGVAGRAGRAERHQEHADERRGERDRPA
jgi:hypothetical protein